MAINHDLVFRNDDYRKAQVEVLKRLVTEPIGSPAPRYHYHVIFEDGEYVATCEEFPFLSFVDERKTGAIRGIVDLVDAVIDEMIESAK